MLRHWKSILLVLALLTLAVVPVAAQDGATIVDLAAGDGNFSTLVTAVQRAGLAGSLSGTGPFTVFAPTNGAFNTALNELGISADDLLNDTATLTNILRYHVVAGRFTASDILAADLPLTLTTLAGSTITVNFDGQRPVINNGRASVERADIIASNGVIHQIDNVLLPPEAPAATTATTPATRDTIVDAVVADGRLTTLLAAVQAAGLANTLSGPGPFTVLAPTDGAFNTLLNELGTSADALLADRALLTGVLTYHVLPGRFAAEDILALDLPASVNTVNGAPITLNFNGQRVIVNNGRASVVQTNIFTSNGVIHILDNVLLPPSN